ncbi:hypothetical protein ALC62_04484 [Cyphomyrmex costatus]|uniref:Uncharacterized protein n=1 Tax=Cyphomyrmex costatus TaxID=456900 RepID=A0A151IK57_9HYME|nr:hypothetical protein ALC62_04484 [Cyphomyrmex costatus]
MRHQPGDDVVVVSRSSLTKSLLRVPVCSRSPGWTRRSSFPHHLSSSFFFFCFFSGTARQCTIAPLSNGDRFRTVWSTLWSTILHFVKDLDRRESIWVEIGKSAVVDSPP